MTKKYKLIREYPGSPTKGTECTQLENDTIDAYPEYWEKVEEIPEYVECIIENSLNPYTRRGIIYKIAANASETDWFIEEDKWSVSKYRFKPSSKEAYERQELLKKAKKKYPVGTKFNSTGGFKNVVIPEDVEFVINNNNVQVRSKKKGFRGEVYNKYRDEWAEIIEDKDYEILAFSLDIGDKSDEYVRYKNKYGKFPSFAYGVSKENNANNEFTEEQLLKNKDYCIYSIRRLSDGVIFTVGDRISWNWSHSYVNYFTITSFEIRKYDKELVFYTKEGIGDYNFKICSPKHYKTPLFKTFDGVDVFEGDKYFYVVENDKIIIHNAWKALSHICDWDNPITPPLGKVQFSTKEAAEQYIEDNKPRFSKKEIEEALAEVWFRDTEEEAVFKLILGL